MVNIRMRTDASGRERPQETDFNEGRRVVRVLPKNDQIRKYLKHPTTRVGFLGEGSTEWPNDVFTKRRIRDGDVTVEVAAEQTFTAGEQKAGEQLKVIDKSGAKAAENKPQPQ